MLDEHVHKPESTPTCEHVPQAQPPLAMGPQCHDTFTLWTRRGRSLFFCMLRKCTYVMSSVYGINTTWAVYVCKHVGGRLSRCCSTDHFYEAWHQPQQTMSKTAHLLSQSSIMHDLLHMTFRKSVILNRCVLHLQACNEPAHPWVSACSCSRSIRTLKPMHGQVHIRSLYLQAASKAKCASPPSAPTSQSQ